MSNLTFLFGSSVSQTKDFDYIDWGRLCEMVRKPQHLAVSTPDQAKRYSSIIGATNAPSKCLEDVIAHNQFTLLRLDLDDTELTLDSIIDALEGGPNS